MTVSADGIEAHENYVSVLREYADELAGNGMEYEEQDRRAEPVTTTLLVSIAVTTVVTTTLSEVIKKIIDRLCDKAKKEKAPTSIQFTINTTNYVLPQDRPVVIEAVNSLTEPLNEPHRNDPGGPA
jgi:hypothetical protein